MPEPADTDWAYAAGFVDGEGSIAIVRSSVPARGRYQYGVHVVVANCERSVLDWMQDICGVAGLCRYLRDQNEPGQPGIGR
jgi:hypothetical protein